MPRLKDQDKIRQREKQAYDFYISRGYTPAQASGIVGNLVWESKMNTTAVGDKNLEDKAYGIAQWRGPREKQFKKLYGKSIPQASFEEQLEFVDWELKNSHTKAYKLLSSADTPEKAGQVISDYYEIPQKKWHENSGRQQAVSSVYKSYADASYNPADTARSIREGGDLVRQTMAELSYVQSPLQTDYSIPQQPATTPRETEEKSATETEDPYKKSIERKIDLYNFVQGTFQQQQNELQAFHNQQEQNQPQQQEQLIDPYAEFLSQPPQQFQNGGQIPVSPNGVYDYPQQNVIVPTSGNITMRNVDYPILGTSMETGQTQLMQPNSEYFFPQTQFVLEQPLLQK